MYSVKPYYQPGKQVELPDVMYKMKNLHADGNNVTVCFLVLTRVLGCAMGGAESYYPRIHACIDKGLAMHGFTWHLWMCCVYLDK